MPKLDAAAWENSKYHKGGFEPKMTKREAALILGVSPNAPLKRVGFVQTTIQLKGWGRLIRNALTFPDSRLAQKSNDSEPPGPWRQPLPGGQDQ